MRYLVLGFLLTGCLFSTGPVSVDGGMYDDGGLVELEDGEPREPGVVIAALGDPGGERAPEMGEDMGMAGMGGQAADQAQDEPDAGPEPEPEPDMGTGGTPAPALLACDELGDCCGGLTDMADRQVCDYWSGLRGGGDQVRCAELLEDYCP